MLKHSLGIAILSLTSLTLLLGACSSSSGRSDSRNQLDLSDNNWSQHWHAINDSQWRREADGALTAEIKATTGFLVSNQRYADFELSLEFWIAEETNSGVFIRTADAGEVTADNAYEINIWDRHPRQEIRTGAIVNHFSPPLAQVQTEGRWNRLEIRAEASRIRAHFNGTLTADLRDDTYREGYIALQSAGPGAVKFRNIRLRAL